MSNNTRHAPIIPWQPSNIPRGIQEELNRRKINRSFRYIQGQQQGGWDNVTDGDWKKYRGPMVSWIRMCSNGEGRPSDDSIKIGDPNKYVYDKQRFVLYSGKGFYQSYGFSSPTENTHGSKYQVIGYTPENEQHIIENALTLSPRSGEPANYPIHVPPPEISRIEVTVQKELLRRAEIEWVCFSWKQLAYMTPYFLVPGITCMVEWGWNHYNIQSLVDLRDKKKMQDLWDNAYPLYFDNILMSNGNYDVIYGIVTNFNWSIEGNKILCNTEITSKDRLYAGIAKDYGLTVDDKEHTENNGIFQSIKTFIDNKSTFKNLRNLVTAEPVTSQLKNDQSDENNCTWFKILNPLLTIQPQNPDNTNSNSNTTNTTGTTKIQQDQLAIRSSYVFGVFSGRQTETDQSPLSSIKMFGPPKQGDFDYNTKDKDTSNHFWINMGLVAAILNHFSTSDSGTKNKKSMFEVDIQNTIIGAHPNLISCDPRVLIPNYKAPKFFYGLVGFDNNVKGGTTGADPKYPYSNQIVSGGRVISGDVKLQNKQDKKVKDVLLQPNNSCYRDNLDTVINYNRYRWANSPYGKGLNSPLKNYSFPSHDDENIVLPSSPRNLAGNQLETDWSGLLSNIYISFSLLEEAVHDEANLTYLDIYKYILQVLMGASDGFWDLIMVDADGSYTITDKKFIGKYALKAQEERVYSFDYYDADSIIKSLKFKPVLSDAQATRTIYGEVNNANSRYKYMDKNDVLDYKFKDAVIGNKEDKKQSNTSQRDLEAGKYASNQLKSILSSVQTINSENDDGSLQMSLSKSGAPEGRVEIIKLVLPDPQLLRLLLNDADMDNNPRYCAVQPGIILELTLQGIGGLRTFQYFTVRNLPEPYSDRNIIFRITDVVQTLETGNWETLIRAQPLPLRGFIKKRLTGPYTDTKDGWLPDPTP
jgi:hypothetical protein